MFSRKLLLAIFSFVSIPAFAQVVGATVSGVVTDPTGAAIANASVVVHNNDTGTQRTLVTGSSGAFSAPSISVGDYTIM